MSASTRTRMRLAVLAAGAMTAVTSSVLAVTPAAAVESPGYTHETATFSFAQGYYTGGYVDCPAGGCRSPPAR